MHCGAWDRCPESGGEQEKAGPQPVYRLTECLVSVRPFILREAGHGTAAGNGHGDSSEAAEQSDINDAQTGTLWLSPGFQMECWEKLVCGSDSMPARETAFVHLLISYGGSPDFSVKTGSGRGTAAIGAGPSGFRRCGDSKSPKAPDKRLLRKRTQEKRNPGMCRRRTLTAAGSGIRFSLPDMSVRYCGRQPRR